MNPWTSGHRCAECGRRDRWSAFSDETIRNKRYGIAVALACGCRQNALEKAIRQLLLPGQRRLHMAKEQPRRRREILSAIQKLRITGVYAEAQGSELDARAACWGTLVPHLLDLNVRKLHIEQVVGSEHVDRASISDALAKRHSLDCLEYHHMSHRGVPLLWLADAMAWAVGRGEQWAERLRDVVLKI